MSTRISGLLFNVGEELPCQREDGNRADPFAVAVVRWEAIVGHVAKKIYICSRSLSTPGVTVGLEGRPEIAYNAICFTLDLKLFCGPRARRRLQNFARKNFVV